VATPYFVEYLLFVFITSPFFLCENPQKNIDVPFVIRIKIETFKSPRLHIIGENSLYSVESKMRVLYFIHADLKRYKRRNPI